MKILAPLLVGLFITSTASAVEGFQHAKHELLKINYELQQKEDMKLKTIYCNCPVEVERLSKKKFKYDLDISTCYKPRKNKERAQRIEIEHIVPAWVMGHQKRCWQQGGRKKCGEDKSFRIMEGDLHNLALAVGEANADRSNYTITAWGAKADNTYGQCPIVIERFKKRNKRADSVGGRIQIPEYARGFAARAYLYMSDRYKIRLSKQDRKLYEAWNRMYAPDSFECKRNELIKRVQGNDNRFISEQCR